MHVVYLHSFPHLSAPNLAEVEDIVCTQLVSGYRTAFYLDLGLGQTLIIFYWRHSCIIVKSKAKVSLYLQISCRLLIDTMVLTDIENYSLIPSHGPWCCGYNLGLIWFDLFPEFRLALDVCLWKTRGGGPGSLVGRAPITCQTWVRFSVGSFAQVTPLTVTRFPVCLVSKVMAEKIILEQEQAYLGPYKSMSNTESTLCTAAPFVLL